MPLTMNELGLGDHIRVGPQVTPAAARGTPIIQRGPHGARFAPAVPTPAEGGGIRWWREEEKRGWWQPQQVVSSVMGLGALTAQERRAAVELGYDPDDPAFERRLRRGQAAFARGVQSVTQPIEKIDKAPPPWAPGGPLDPEASPLGAWSRYVLAGLGLVLAIQVVGALK